MIKVIPFSIELQLKQRQKQTQTRRNVQCQKRSIHEFVFGWPSRYLILILDEALSGLEIGLNHLLNKGIEVNFALPSKNALGLCWIS